MDPLVGLVVKASASTAEDPGFESRLRRDFSVVKASASRAKDPGFESRLRRDFSGIESYQ